MEGLYTPLDAERREIRILHLQSGEWTDEIECTLMVVSLYDSPDFLTLSYVWGDPSQTVNIKVNGHNFHTTVKLEMALRRFRKENIRQALWVNAICINQTNMVERSKQVPLMGQIYKSCRECAIWLGEIEEESISPIKLPGTWRRAEIDHLEELIRELKITESPKPLQRAGKHGDDPIDVEGAFEVMELMAAHKHLYEMPFFTVPSKGIPRPGTAFELSRSWAKTVYSLENILRRSWWQRIWTVQEAILPEKATLHVGPHSAPFSTFMLGAHNWHEHMWTHCCSSLLKLWVGYTLSSFVPVIDRVLDLNILHKVRTKEWTIENSVAHNMYLLSIQRNATISHDQVYGLFGLIKEFFHIDDSPDYNLRVGQAFAATTNRFMENAKHLCLLPYARPQLRSPAKDESKKEERQDLPSWCPDWSATAWGDYFDIYNYGGFTADTNLVYDGSRQNDTILKLEGIHVDNIALVGELIPNMKVSPAETTPIIERWLHFMAQRDLGPRALWELIHVATHQHVGLDKVDLQENYWELVKRLAAENASYQELKDAVMAEKHQFCNDSTEWLDKRAVYVTDPDPSNVSSTSEYRSACPKGTVGMALPYIRQADAIFIVKGGRTPLIFRPISDPSLRENALKSGIMEDGLSRCYTYVGVSYVYGLMQGQGIAQDQHWEGIYLL